MSVGDGWVDIRTVAELMGHRRIQMTMRYAHLAPQHKLAAVECLNMYNSSASLGTEPTDTRTDTGHESRVAVGPAAVN